MRTWAALLTTPSELATRSASWWHKSHTKFIRTLPRNSQRNMNEFPNICKGFLNVASPLLNIWLSGVELLTKIQWANSYYSLRLLSNNAGAIDNCTQYKLSRNHSSSKSSQSRGASPLQCWAVLSRQIWPLEKNWRQYSLFSRAKAEVNNQLAGHRKSLKIADTAKAAIAACRQTAYSSLYDQKEL